MAPLATPAPTAMVAMCSLLRVPSSQVTITRAPCEIIAGTFAASQSSPALIWAVLFEPSCMSLLSFGTT